VAENLLKDLKGCQECVCSLVEGVKRKFKFDGHNILRRCGMEQYFEQFGALMSVISMGLGVVTTICAFLVRSSLLKKKSLLRLVWLLQEGKTMIEALAVLPITHNDVVTASKKKQ
jgi:hypothetical protein